MMRLGMLIDVDHMSQAAVDQALTLAQSFGYPVNSGHNGIRGSFGTDSQTERSLRPDQYASIGKLHGMAGVGSSGTPADQWRDSYNLVVQTMGAGAVAGFGTDTDGFALGMPPPKPAAGTPPAVQYSAAFPQSTDGNKKWDYNNDGVAHYGMLTDFLQDVGSHANGKATIDNLMQGAEYFYQTWAIAEAKKTTIGP
jgi:microsomal dipeptidase-like Zn-dependent dipeptidase